jgi:penicillin-binding protein 2
VDLHKAIVHSCDVFFYNLGKQLGIDRISFYAGNLGLGHRTGVDLPGEETGVMPSEAWKQRVFHQKWYPGETISVAIGQGAIAVTPIQLAYMISGIVTGGRFHRPHLMLSDKAAPEIDFPISDSTVYTVTEGMYGVVNEPGGTGSGSKLPGIELCGKTGSAQVISNQGLARAGKHADLNDNAWFVGFAPRQNPEIVVSVLVQGGQHGATAAAPIARDIVKAYYDKKQGKIPPQQLTTQAVPPGIPPSFAAQAARANKAEPEAEEGVPTNPDPVPTKPQPVSATPQPAPPPSLNP